MLSKEEPEFQSLITKILSINYQGAFELTSEALEVIKTGKHFRSTTEIFMNSYSNFLVISYPIYSSLLKDLERNMQYQFDILEKSLGRTEMHYN